MKLRLTSRIVLFFVLLAAVLLAVVGGLAYRNGSKSLQDAAISEMLVAAVEKEAALDTWIEERLDDIVQISSPADMAEKAAALIAAPPASEGARSAHAVLLQELQPRLAALGHPYLELFVLDPESGKVMASTSAAREGKFKLGHPYYDNGKKGLYLQAPYYSADLAGPAMTAATPLRTADGRVVAVLAVRLDLAAMDTIARRRTGLRQTDDSFLFNAEQFPVTQPRFINEPAVLRRKLDTEAIRRCAAHNSGVALAPDYRGVPSIAVYRWNAKRQLGLTVKIDQAEALGPARAFGRSVVLISGLALFASVGLAFLLARTIIRPLITLHNGVRRFAEGNFQEPAQESSSDEVGLLAGEFNAMAARVVERTAELARVNEALKAENAERKRGEESLRASQQLIEGIINAIPVRVFWKDKNLVFLGCNAVFARDAGFAEPKDLIGKDDYQMGWRDQAELYRAGDRQVIGSGCARPLVEEPQTTPEGNTITLLTSKIPLRDSKGEVTGMIGTSMDVTDRQQAEEVLRERVKLQEQLVHTAASVPGMLYSLLMRPDGSTRMPYASGALSEIFDLQPKDVLDDAARVFLLIHPDDLGHVMATIAESARTLNPWRDDFRVGHSRLGEIWVEGHSVPQREPDGSTLWHGFIQNITERKETEEELRRTSELLLRTGELAKVGGWELDLRTMKLFWSVETGRIHEVDPPVAPALDQAINFYAPEARPVIQAALQAGIDAGAPFDLDLPLTTAKGRSIWVRAQGSAVMEDGKAVKLLGAFQDITERKQVEEARRRSEAKFRTLYDSTSDAIMLSDPTGFFDCNQATLAMFGCGTREEFCSKHPADVSPPIQPDGIDSLTLAKQYMATAMEKGSYQFEWMHKRADTGETFPAEVLLCALELDGKRVLQGSVRDITERKRSEASLRLQSVALEAAANAIVITNQNGKIQSVNPAFTALTGYTAQEAVGQNPRILKSGKQDEAFYRKLWQTISSGQVWSGEMTNRRKDGSLYAEEMTITPLRNADGVIVRYIAIKQDITERKRVAEALRLSEEQFRVMFELASVGIAQADPHTGQWLRVNKKMCEITGYSADELLQMRVPDITHPEDRHCDGEAFERVVRGEAPDYCMEKRYIRKDGALAWVNVNMTVIRDAAGQPTRTLAAIEDILGRKRAQVELEDLHKQLVDASRRAGMAEIATSVLHNVGNVLNSINISTGLIVESSKKSRASSLARVVVLLKEHAHDLGTFITQDSRGKHVPAHLAQLAEHLQVEQEANIRELELLRRNVDHVKEIVAVQQNYASFGGVKEMVNVVNLVEDSLRMNEGALNRHEVAVVREFEDVPPLNAEKHKILQILVNLLRNAKYACHDSERADKRLTVRVANGEGRVRISVIDNGIGIPPENLTRIFNHGFTTRKHGHGFGLHSGALAAKEMGGSLTVHSDGPGQGAAFTLELPCPTPENRHE